MKIKTQFYISLTIIFVIPFIFLGIILLEKTFYHPNIHFVPGYEEIINHTDSQITKKDWKRITCVISKRPSFIDYIILDKSNRIIYSTISEYVANSFLQNEQIMKIIKDTGRTYMYQLDNPLVTSDIIVISRILRAKHVYPRKYSQIVTYVIIFYMFVVILCSIIFTRIIRSISHSVTVLEKSTKDIVDGNLEVEIDVKGSNEIISLTKSLNIMRQNLMEAQYERSRFIMGVSHDLRTPVALIKGYAEAIMDGMVSTPEDIKKSLNLIVNKTDQLNELIGDLIDFVKLNTGEWKNTLQLKNITELLNKFSHQLKVDGELLKKNVVCEINVKEDIMIPLDEKLFNRVLENLTGNAFRYSGEMATIGLNVDYTSDQKDTLVIAISDNGIGISKDDLPYIYEPYYRGTNSRREEGCGLGLSIVKNIVHSCGWKIYAESERNVKTTFFLEIPLAIENKQTIDI